METSNIFQRCGKDGLTNQNQISMPYPTVNNANWNGYPNVMIQNQQPYYPGGFINRTPPNNQQSSNIPVRVIFSPEQIAPQEIPTNGTPALFPLSDGSKIIAKSLLGNGLFDERVYVLQVKNYDENDKEGQLSEFEQVMKRLDGIERGLNKVINDLYGVKVQTNQEGAVNNE